MTRTLLAALIAAAVATAAPLPAAAQVFNPNTPVVPPPPPSPIPPAAMPHLEPIPAPAGSGSHKQRIPRIGVGSPSAETHQDRAVRCAHQGAVLGVPAGAMGQYVGECVSQ